MNCKCCGSETEPILNYTPIFDGGFAPSSVEITVEGYEEYCEGCDNYWQEIVAEQEIVDERALPSDTYDGDDLPF